MTTFSLRHPHYYSTLFVSQEAVQTGIRIAALSMMICAVIFAYCTIASFTFGYRAEREWSELSKLSKSQAILEETYAGKIDAMRSEGGVSLGLIASDAPHYIASFPLVARAGI